MGYRGGGGVRGCVKQSLIGYDFCCKCACVSSRITMDSTDSLPRVYAFIHIEGHIEEG